MALVLLALALLSSHVAIAASDGGRRSLLQATTCTGGKYLKDGVCVNVSCVRFADKTDVAVVAHGRTGSCRAGTLAGGYNSTMNVTMQCLQSRYERLMRPGYVVAGQLAGLLTSCDEHN